MGKQEPDPDYVQDLSAPVWLDAKAAAVWGEIAPNLAKAKLLTVVDMNTLAMGCVSIAQYRQAVSRAGDELVRHAKPEEAMTVAGNDVVIEAKGESLNPWLIVQSMAFKQAMLILREFGMSPAARTRIAINPQGDLFGKGEKEAGAAHYFATR